MATILVFIWFKYSKFKFDKINKFIQKISEYCFGIDLVHVLIIEQIDKYFGFNTLSFNPIISSIVISLIVFIISLLISLLLNHIPFIKKYIV